MELMGVKLKLGNTYRIQHKRKGEFVVQLIGIEEITHPADIDDFFLTCRYDVRAYTDQIHLSTKPGKDAVRTSNLRPSLITSIEPIEEHWLRELKIPQEEKTAFQKLVNKIKGGE